MIKVLVISYHYLPDNIIAARRSEAYAKHFHKFGIFPTIVTDLYEGIFDATGNRTGYKYHTKETRPVTENFDTHKVIRIPRVVTSLQKLQFSFEKIAGISSIFTMLMNLGGHFDMHLLGHYLNYRNFLIKYLKKNKYDLILAIDSPHYHIKLAKFLHQKTGIPYVCDFRDLPNNQMLSSNNSLSIKDKINLNLYVLYLKKWLRKCIFISSTSQIWADYYGKIGKNNAYEITNGFEEEIIFNANQNSNLFTIMHTGRLYSNQDWSIIAKGIRKFKEQANPKNFQVVFAGIRIDAQSIIKKIKVEIPDNIVTYGWLTKNEIVRLQNNCHIFILSSWNGYIGVYSGKIFEYLGARKPILFAPGDYGDVIDQLLIRTKAGVCAYTPDEVCNYITKKYTEWLKTGEIKYEGIEAEIIKYSRENQVRKMANLIHKVITPIRK
ncbi:MAG: hypothetical protein ACOCUQ_02755 [Bacteroidota bacterium]